MASIIISANILNDLSFLSKHLLDDPKTDYTKLPLVSADGSNIVDIKTLAAVMNVTDTIASVYATQDPSASNELKQDAINHIDQKWIRMVRTPAGVRKFKQKQGSIIVDDGEEPLDAITALPNDVPGYEKIADKNGVVYYVGNENGKWSVRTIAGNTAATLYSGDSLEDSLYWLNSRAGGIDKNTNGTEQKPTS